VTGLQLEGDRCTGVMTERGAVAAGAVVSAVAGWTSIVAKMAGLELPISTHALQAFVTEPYSHALDGLVSSMDLYIYVSQTARGELLAGAEILPYNTYSTRSTFGFLSEAAKRSIQILPFMAGAKAMRQWTGLCDMTPDSSPILGETDVERFFLMAGMGTWGFKGSPVFGRTMAELVATGHTPELIAPFAPGRFRTDRMVPDAASAGTH
jgi:sarcosine oxidase, subunit beta